LEDVIDSSTNGVPVAKNGAFVCCGGGNAMKMAPFAIAIAVMAVLGGSAAVWGVRAPETSIAEEATWTEANWPFLQDQWGIGEAFVCMPADCGAKIEVFIRPKIGFCNCSTGVSDDAELERVADTDLVSPTAKPLGPGGAVKIGWMSGRSRRYSASDEKPSERLLSIAFNDECDAVVALATLGNGDPAAIEPAVIAFLNRRPMVLWVKKELGLEFVRREW
jgi:hypothetical protein